MANVILKLSEIEDFFQNLIMQILGLDPDLPENQDIVRISWPSTGAPAWKRTEDRTFIRVLSGSGNIDYYRQKSISYGVEDVDNALYTMEFTRPWTIQFTVYGPNSFDNAQNIKNSILLPNILELCNGENLYIDLNIGEPVRAPELYNGQWWERTDLSVSFNEYVKIETTIPFIKSVQVLLKDEVNTLIINAKEV